VRNHRRRLSVAAALVAVLAVAGCLRAGSGNAGGAGPSSAPPVTSAPAPTAATSQPAPAPTVIPVGAFLALPKEMRAGDIRTRAEFDNAVPRLCGGEFASGGATAASASVMSAYRRRGNPADSIPSGVLYQTIRTYPGDGAAAFMERLRDDMDSCTAYRRQGVSFKARTRPLPGVGDEALTIDVVQPQTDLPGNPVGGEQTNRAVTIRVGDTVTILWDAEYERSSSDATVVADFARGAVVAIKDWREA
jgi:hypothetical protein